MMFVKGESPEPAAGNIAMLDDTAGDQDPRTVHGIPIRNGVVEVAAAVSAALEGLTHDETGNTEA